MHITYLLILPTVTENASRFGLNNGNALVAFNKLLYARPARLILGWVSIDPEMTSDGNYALCYR